MQTSDLTTYAAAFVFVIALILIGGWLLRRMSGSGGNGGGMPLLRGRDRRLGVVEATSLDNRRKLVLIRRDSVEHLIITGGPVDMLVESGIRRGDTPVAHKAADHSGDVEEERIVIAPGEDRPGPAHDKM